MRAAWFELCDNHNVLVRDDVELLDGGGRGDIQHVYSDY